MQFVSRKRDKNILMQVCSLDNVVICKILESFIRRVKPRIDSSSHFKKRKLIQKEKEKNKRRRKFHFSVAIFLTDLLRLMHCNNLESFAQYRIVMRF